MSEMEFRIGRVKEVSVDAVGFEGKIRQLAEDTGRDHNDFLDYKDNFTEEYMEYRCGYEWVNGKIYELLEDKDFENDDICIAERSEDGTISYKLKYYNGGTCFSEMLEEAISRMEKK